MKRVFYFLLILMLFFSFPVYSNAAQNNAQVKMTMPNYNVFINSMMIDNQGLKYPFLVYDNITYFPMTWGFSQSLGFKTEWDSKKGLKISKTGKFDYLEKEYSSNSNVKSKTLYGKKANFDIEINGKNIDNSKQKYPLIVYNNITYFPLTHEFATNEFGLDLKWDDYIGLRIYGLEDNNLKDLMIALDKTYYLPSYNFKADLDEDVIEGTHNLGKSISGTHTTKMNYCNFIGENKIKFKESAAIGSGRVEYTCYGTGKSAGYTTASGEWLWANMRLLAGDHLCINITEFKIGIFDFSYINSVTVLDINENLKKYIVIRGDFRYEYVIDTKKQLLQSYSYKRNNESISLRDVFFEYN